MDADGPGKLTKRLGITGEYNRLTLENAEGFRIEDDGFRCGITTAKRVGIGYAAQEDQDKLWRFIMDEKGKLP